MSRPFAPRELTHAEFWGDFVAADWPAAAREAVVGRRRRALPPHGPPAERPAAPRRHGPTCSTAPTPPAIPVGIVSNALSGQVHLDWLAEHGLTDRFAVTIHSDAARVRKPNPEMIRLATARARRRPGRGLVRRRQLRPRRALRPPRRHRRQHPDGGQGHLGAALRARPPARRHRRRPATACSRCSRPPCARPRRDPRPTPPRSAPSPPTPRCRCASRCSRRSARRWRSTTRPTCTISSPATTARPRRRSAASSSPACPTRPSSARRTARSGTGRIAWYVDPIDGTANFARGLASWCVSVGAVVGGEIVAGAIVDPVGGNVFSADLGGAWLNGAPIRSRAVPDERRATLITGYPVARDFRLDGRERGARRLRRRWSRPSRRCAAPAAPRSRSPRSPPAGPTPPAASASTPGTSRRRS